MTFHAVILSGGSGERFWPLSTPARPKQFLTVFGGKSLLRQAVDRLDGLVPPERIHVVTAKSLMAATRRELPEIPRANLVGEPCRRDTGAAVAVACAQVERIAGENAVVAILTADQLMADVKAFRRMLADAAIAAAKTRSIVTMGVAPTYPATGFGYIRFGAKVPVAAKTEFRRVSAFVEKPDERTAKRYLASGDYVWNAGMFVWRVDTMKRALVEHAPALAILEAAAADPKNRVSSVVAKLYPQLPKISFDYAVMEKARDVVVSSGDFGWDDVGTWSSAAKHLPSDARGNVVKGAVTLLDAESTVAVAEGPRIAALGVKDLVVVTTKDAVLVAHKSRAQDLKKLLAAMPGA